MKFCDYTEPWMEAANYICSRKPGHSGGHDIMLRSLAIELRERKKRPGWGVPSKAI